MVTNDSALLHEGIVGLLMRQGHETAAEAAGVNKLVEAAAHTAPDVVVTDVRIPPGVSDDGLRAAAQIRESQPEIGITMLSRYVAPAYVAKLFEPSASTDGVGGLGYLLRDRVVRIADFIRSLGVAGASGVVVDPEVVSSLVKGRSSWFNGLVVRESEVFELMAQGLSNHQIRERVFLSTAAVSEHVANVPSKLSTLLGEENRGVRAVLAHLMEKWN